MSVQIHTNDSSKTTSRTSKYIFPELAETRERTKRAKKARETAIYNGSESNEESLTSTNKKSSLNNGEEIVLDEVLENNRGAFFQQYERVQKLQTELQILQGQMCGCLLQNEQIYKQYYMNRVGLVGNIEYSKGDNVEFEAGGYESTPNPFEVNEEITLKSTKTNIKQVIVYIMTIYFIYIL